MQEVEGVWGCWETSIRQALQRHWPSAEAVLQSLVAVGAADWSWRGEGLQHAQLPRAWPSFCFSASLWLNCFQHFLLFHFKYTHQYPFLSEKCMWSFPKKIGLNAKCSHFQFINAFSACWSHSYKNACVDSLWCCQDEKPYIAKFYIPKVFSVWINQPGSVLMIILEKEEED